MNLSPEPTDYIAKDHTRSSKTIQKSIQNIGWLSFGQIFRLVTSVFITAWVAKYLGPEDLGTLMYAISFVALFSFVGVLGLDQIIVREFVKMPENKDLILGTALTLRLLGGSILILLTTAGMNIFSHGDKQLTFYVAIIAFGTLFGAFDVIDSYYQYRIESRYSVISKNLAYAFVCILKVILILMNFPLVWFVLASAFETILSGCSLFLSFLLNKHSIQSWKYSSQMAKSLLTDSWPLMSGMLFINVYMRIDQIMIPSYMDRSALGIYSVAVYLCQFWYFFPMAISKTAFPQFVELKSKDRIAYYARLKQLYALMFWIGIAAGVFFTLFGKILIQLLCGNEFTGAYSALVINIWSGVFVSQALARGVWIVAENLQKYRLLIQMSIAVINILGNLYLIPKIGIKGAALSTLISQGLGTWILPLLLKPMRLSTISMIKAANPCFLSYKSMRRGN